MVFDTVQIIRGHLLSHDDLCNFVEYLKNFFGADELKNFFGVDESKRYPFLDEKSFDPRENLHLINDLISRFKGVKLYAWPCCSGVEGKYLLGHSVKKYSRLTVKCDVCEEYTCCDVCLGLTENGLYDVRKIFNEVV